MLNTKFMTKIGKTTKISKKGKRSLTSNLSTEERLHVIANLIVDRIIEDQLNGNLRFRGKADK